MRTIFLFLLVSFLNLSANAQRSQFILGKWKFKDVADKHKLDSNTLKEANIYFGRTTYSFAADGTAEFNSIKGTWAFNKDETIVSLTISNPSDPSQKTTAELKIASLTANELRIDMQRAIIIYDRAPKETKAPEQPKPAPQTQPKPTVAEVDKDAAIVYALYKRRDAIIRPKIKNLLQYLEASMKMDRSGEFNRSSWQYYSDNIIQKCSEIRKELGDYKGELAGLGHKYGENKLTDLLNVFFTSAGSFINDSEYWGRDISQKDLDSDSILKHLERMEKSSNLMKKEDYDVLNFIAVYTKRNGL